MPTVPYAEDDPERKSIRSRGEEKEQALHSANLTPPGKISAPGGR